MISTNDNLCVKKNTSCIKYLINTKNNKNILFSEYKTDLSFLGKSHMYIIYTHNKLYKRILETMETTTRTVWGAIKLCCLLVSRMK